MASSTLVAMTIDLFTPIINAIVALPGVYARAIESDPGPWELAGLGFLALLVLAYVARRARGRRRVR